jgi:hypothetical protein
MDLMDVTKLFQQRDAIAHYWDFLRPINDFLDADGVRAASIDGAFVVLDWDELAFVTIKQTSTSGEAGRPGHAPLALNVTNLVRFVAFLHDALHQRVSGSGDRYQQVEGQGVFAFIRWDCHRHCAAVC